MARPTEQHAARRAVRQGARHVVAAAGRLVAAGALAVLAAAVVVPSGAAGAVTPTATTAHVDEVLAWGENVTGELGPSTTGLPTCSWLVIGTVCAATPVPVALPAGVTPMSVAGGVFGGYAVGSDGHLYAWGDNRGGSLGNGGVTGPVTCTDFFDGPCSPVPVPVDLPTGVTAESVAGGLEVAFAIGSDGNLYGWGLAASLPGGPGTTTACSAGACSPAPVRLAFPAGVTPVSVAAGSSAAYALGSNGDVYDLTSSATPTAVALPAGVTASSIAVNASGTDAYAVATDGTLYGWGGNGHGQLGTGSTSTTTPLAVPLPTGATVLAVAASNHTTFALTSTGAVYALGSNAQGELGDGSTGGPVACSATYGASAWCSPTAVRVALPAGATATAISASGYDGYAISSTGTIYAWGSNFFDALGDGSASSPTTCANGPCATTPVAMALPAGSSPVAVAGRSLAPGGGYLLTSVPAVAPQLTSTCPTAAVTQTAYTCTVDSTGTPVASLSATGVPPGLTFTDQRNGTGVLAGSPTASGAFTVTVTAGNGIGTPASEQFVLDVATAMAPAFTSTCPATQLDVGSTVACTVGATGEPVPTLAASGLPAGVAFADNGGGTGTLSGSPTVSGTFTVTVTAANGIGTPASEQVTLTVDGPPSFTSTCSPDAVDTQAYTCAVTTSGFPAPSLKATGVPPGMTFTDEGNGTGSLSGSPDTPGDYSVVLTATNPLATATQTLTLTVQQLGAPDVTLQPVGDVVPTGQTAVFTAAATGTPAPTVQWQYSTDGGTTWTDITTNATATTTTLSGGIFGTFENGWEVRAVFTNSVGSATTAPAVLTVPPDGTIVITVQPQDAFAAPGLDASFQAAAVSTLPLTVQWQYSTDGGTTWTDITSNPTATTTTLTGVIYGTFENGWEVRAVFSNGVTTATTDAGFLTVSTVLGP